MSEGSSGVSPAGSCEVSPDVSPEGFERFSGLQLKASIITEKRGIWKFQCGASVDNELACTATIMCADRKL